MNWWRAEALADHPQGGRKLTLRETRISLPPPLKPLRPEEVAAIRRKLGLSQAVFAAVLNVPKATALSWEHGARRPSGAALKLLRLAETNPEAVLAAA